MTGTVESALHGLVAALSDHDLDRIMDHFSDDCVLQMPRGPHPYGQRSEGKAAVRAGLATRFEGLPDVHYGDDAHFVCGDTGISKWQVTGTAKDGAKTDVHGCDFYTFRDGKVAGKDSYWRIVA